MPHPPLPLRSALPWLLALLVTLMGCGSSSTESSSSSSSSSTSDASGSGSGVSGLTVAFIPKVTGNAFFESANNGAQNNNASRQPIPDPVSDRAQFVHIRRIHFGGNVLHSLHFLNLLQQFLYDPLRKLHLQSRKLFLQFTHMTKG